MQVQVHHTLISTSDLEATLGFRKNMVGSRVVLLQHADFAKTVNVQNIQNRFHIRRCKHGETYPDARIYPS